jgi:4-amino-4-deoxy-L-arabinose transferase-like glycosyltransferase
MTPAPGRIALGLGGATLLFRLATAGRYDFFRDELYFIACGRHPAFGYVDQPPLVPLLSAGLYALGHQLWVLRLPCAIAAAALVWLTVQFVRLLGGGNAAAIAAGLAVATAPMFLGLLATFNTTAFEPLAWTAVAYLIARAILRGQPAMLVWAGIVSGIAMEAKYSIPAWLAALGLGLALFAERRLFVRRELWIGLAAAAALAAPSVVWQAANHWPFLELVRAAGDKNEAVAPLGFVVNQLLVMNPIFAPLWLAGIAAPFVSRELAPLRFLSVGFLAVAALLIATQGKDYYLAAAYPPMFALGAVAFERAVRNAPARIAYIAAGVALAALVAPATLPILPPAQIAPYMQRLRLTPPQEEKSFAGTALPQIFADQLGWRDFVREVATAYAALPPAERARTSVLVDNYGEAAALDAYGGPYGLPPALSGHNEYYLWALRGQNPVNVLRVQRHPERLRRRCARLRLTGTTFSQFAMAYENGKTIAFCGALRGSLAGLWPQLKDYE